MFLEQRLRLPDESHTCSHGSYVSKCIRSCFLYRIGVTRSPSRDKIQSDPLRFGSHVIFHSAVQTKTSGLSPKMTEALDTVIIVLVPLGSVQSVVSVRRGRGKQTEENGPEWMNHIILIISFDYICLVKSFLYEIWTGCHWRQGEATVVDSDLLVFLLILISTFSFSPSASKDVYIVLKQSGSYLFIRMFNES